MDKYVLKLFVTGKTARSEQAIESLRNICATHPETEIELEIIDVLDSPEMAESEKVMATPTLIKELPPPIRRLVGDLNNQEKVLLYLDLKRVKENLE